MNEWSKEFLANSSDLDWADLDDEAETNICVSASIEKSLPTPTSTTAHSTVAADPKLRRSPVPPHTAQKKSAEDSGTASRLRKNNNNNNYNNEGDGKRRSRRQKQQQQHRSDNNLTSDDKSSSSISTDHRSSSSKSPLRPAPSRLFNGAIQSINDQISSHYSQQQPQRGNSINSKQQQHHHHHRHHQISLAPSSVFNHRQEADNLRQTIVSFQAPTIRRLNEVIDIIHQHAGVTQEFIIWRRLVPSTSDSNKRPPIAVVRYCQKELARIIRYACSEFIKQTECHDFDYGPVDSQLAPKVDITELGRKVFRSERGLDDLYEREGIPGLISLWLFIWEFSEPKLGRSLEFYFEEWLKDINVCKRNTPFLQCDDGWPVLRRWDFEPPSPSMPFQTKRHEFHAPAGFRQLIGIPSKELLIKANRFMETVVIAEFQPASLPAISLALGGLVSDGGLFEGCQPFDPWQLMMDESKIADCSPADPGPAYSTLTLQTVTATADAETASIRWIRYVQRSPNSMLALIRLRDKSTAENIRQTLLQTTATFVGGPLGKDNGFKLTANWSADIVSTVNGMISLDSLWKNSNFNGIVSIILHQILASGGSGGENKLNSLYSNLLSNSRFGLDGRRQALTYLSLIGPEDFD